MIYSTHLKQCLTVFFLSLYLCLSRALALSFSPFRVCLRCCLFRAFSHNCAHTLSCSLFLPPSFLTLSLSPSVSLSLSLPLSLPLFLLSVSLSHSLTHSLTLSLSLFLSFSLSPHLTRSLSLHTPFPTFLPRRLIHMTSFSLS